MGVRVLVLKLLHSYTPNQYFGLEASKVKTLCLTKIVNSLKLEPFRG
ncbi:hypothetical protein NOS3756_05440 [Nostoc sp. NIES-3756]|nr:hypothetical protein NOS3756_05440 [Nostoc sp. NIES-3756]